MPTNSEFASHWTLDPEWDFLNHGSFGATPRFVLEEQARLRALMERQPVQFLARLQEELLDAARTKLGAFIGAEGDDLAFMPNATHGVNTIVRSLIDAKNLKAGDELLTTNHAYQACRNALEVAAKVSGLKVVVAQVPFPVASFEEVNAAVLAAVTPRTRLAMLDQVTSPTGFILTTPELVAQLRARRVEVLIDGAHGPGAMPVDLKNIGAEYYAGNCHKWMCAPKGAGFLWVRRDLQKRIRPLVISHGATIKRPARSRFRLEFDWMGTVDPTPYLCVPTCIEYLNKLVPGGWPTIMRRNHEMAVAARNEIGAILNVPPPCPEHMLTSMAALVLPDGDDSLQAALVAAKIEAPIMRWPTPRGRVLRISSHVYNSIEQYPRIAQAVRKHLASESK